MRFFTRSAQPVRKNHTVLPSTNLSDGIVPNHVWHLTELSSFAIGFFLEQKGLAHSTINVRLAAVRRLGYEASDTGLLSPDLAAGIRRVKGAKCLGVRIGNWLTVGKPVDRVMASAIRPQFTPGFDLRNPRARPVLVGINCCSIHPREPRCHTRFVT